MTFGKALSVITFALMVSGCETTGSASRPASEVTPASSAASKTIVGDARMASFSAPGDCQRFSAESLRAGGTIRVQTGCVVRTGDAMVVFGLSETKIPIEQAFSVVGGGSPDFQAVASVFPREMLSEHLLKSEEIALSAKEPGWRKLNKKTRLLPGSGGVAGAVACVRFSFDASRTSQPPQNSRTSGIRCSRFGKSADTLEDIMIEVMAFYPTNEKVPANYLSIAEQAIKSLRYRQ